MLEDYAITDPTLIAVALQDLLNAHNGTGDSEFITEIPDVLAALHAWDAIQWPSAPYGYSLQTYVGYTYPYMDFADLDIENLAWISTGNELYSEDCPWSSIEYDQLQGGSRAYYIINSTIAADKQGQYHIEYSFYVNSDMYPHGFAPSPGADELQELMEFIAFVADETNWVSMAKYNPGDIAAVHAIIDSMGLDLPKADPNDGSYVPEEWMDYIGWSYQSRNKRVTNLSLENEGLIGKLDVSELTALQFLNCPDNQLTEINLSGLTELEYLWCYSNKLTKLNLSGLSSLVELNCNFNQLTEMDVTGLKSLQTLMYYGNQLTNLDLTVLTALKHLQCGGNQLTELDLSGLTALEHLECYGNQLTELELSNLTSLWILYCFDNQLTELNLSGLPELMYLHCGSNQLTELDLSGLTALEDLCCGHNQLIELDLSALTALWRLDCSGNQLTVLIFPRLPIWRFCGVTATNSLLLRFVLQRHTFF
ncbi:MAG: leucine-rich repeat domain-containing protein [Clostridiales bacterium]|nr:leucine-rich repeat domain-containing protein [Clostridiales bacterium]